MYFLNHLIKILNGHENPNVRNAILVIVVNSFLSKNTYTNYSDTKYSTKPIFKDNIHIQFVTMDIIMHYKR